MEYPSVCCGGFMSLVLTLLTCACIGVMCSNSTYQTVLNADLINGYNPSVLPGQHYSAQLLNINVSFELRKIQTFDELNGALSILGMLTVAWYDERLDWTPSSYNNLTFTQFKQKEIWTPPFLLVGSDDDINLLGDNDMHIALVYTGVVNWFLPVRLSSSCDADVTYYPFDKQSCDVVLLPWGYSANHIQLNAIGSNLDTKLYTESPTWNLVSTVQQSFQTPTLGFVMTITFKRKPLYFVVNLILPTMFMCVINMLVFILPAESGERVGFSITVLLAIAVFLSIVASILPQTSTPHIALLCYLLIAHIILSVMIIVCTIFGLRFYFRPVEERVPRWIARLTRFVHNVKSAKPNTSKVSRRSQTTVSVITKPDDDGMEMDDDKSDLSDCEVSWKDVGNAFDNVCFVFFIMADMLFNVIFLLVMSAS